MGDNSTNLVTLLAAEAKAMFSFQLNLGISFRMTFFGSLSIWKCALAARLSFL
jgi:hypothetical protein